MTKGEILKKHTEKSQWYAPVCDNAIYSAMQEFADQEAIRFAEWKDLNFEEFDLGLYTPILASDNDYKEPLTIKQLYSKFKDMKEEQLILPKQEESWDDILDKFYDTVKGAGLGIIGYKLTDFLKENYNPPTKRK